jgi:DNA-binding YbaB/EbfC family protein
MSFDMNNLQGMMAQLQTALMAAKAQAEAVVVTGQAGGGMVTVTATAGGEVQSVKLNPVTIDPSEADMLEDLIVAATNDALVKGRELVAAKMAEATGGLPLPPGLM